jgi:hypothetical protein
MVGSGFEQEDVVGAVVGAAGGEGGSRRTGTDDDDVDHGRP